ncbi:hypothetical protein I3760_01G001400 [Carya illinoinensis]|nr:hypothetical protein I3760_01G001400 [Carya illinoinensis]
MIGCMGDNGSESGAIGAMSCGDLHSLSLSVRSSSQSSYVIGSQLISPTVTDYIGMDTKKKGPEKVDQKQIVHRNLGSPWIRLGREPPSIEVLQGIDGLVDMKPICGTTATKKKARVGKECKLESYKKELDEMKNMIRQEYVAHLRRKSSEFSRGASIKRGVTRHHQHGRWQARIGWVAGSKELYLGTFSTQEEAAEAYDITAIKFRGVNAVTNFDITRYDVERIMASSTLLPGEVAKRRKQTGSNMIEALDHLPTDNSNGEASISQKNSECESEWKTADLHQETNHKPPKTESYRT